MEIAEIFALTGVIWSLKDLFINGKIKRFKYGGIMYTL